MNHITAWDVFLYIVAAGLGLFVAVAIPLLVIGLICRIGARGEEKRLAELPKIPEGGPWAQMIREMKAKAEEEVGKKR